MRTTIIILLLGLCWMRLSSQTITNVVATQEGNNAVITYDLECDGSADISLLYCEDDGGSFSGPLTNVSGDIGYNITNGKNKRIVWNVLKGQDVFFGDKVVFRVMGFYKFGKFTDIRDGKTYRTVKIGNQVWMAENLNYKTGRSWCYNNNPANCAIYGRWYNWSTAQKACPVGWHLPSKDEWISLITFLGGSDFYQMDLGKRSYTEGGSEMKDESVNLWKSPHTQSTNSSGFSALPGGWCLSDGSCYMDLITKQAWFWASDLNTKYQYSDGAAWCLMLKYENQRALISYENTVIGLSVRCIKD
jgi:uncharacterized protein (TIGR02145 family)